MWAELRRGTSPRQARGDGEDEPPRVLRGAAVAHVQTSRRCGSSFDRRFVLGDPSDLDYADLDLKADVEAAGYGLPAPEDFTPDDDGIVWF